MYQYTPYIWPYIAIIITNMIMTVYVLKDQHRKGVMAFSITLFFISLWCFGLIMEMCSQSVTTRLFWVKVGFPSYTFGPLAWMIMILELTDQHYWTQLKGILLLSMIPVLTVLFVWTNELHGLIWQYRFYDDGIYSKQYGLWFWVHAVYADGMNIFAVTRALLFWRRKAPLYGGHFKCLAFSVLFIMVVNAFYLLRWTMLDLTPVAWGLCSIFITWALFRNQLFELVPIARNRIFASMAYGIIVLDIKQRLVDINPVACTLFGYNAAQAIGMKAEIFFAQWAELLAAISQDKANQEISYQSQYVEQFFEVTCIPIKNERNSILGKLITIRDITKKKLTEQILLQKQQEIAVKEERERMARDLHDNLGQILGFINLKTQAVQGLLAKGQTALATEYIEHVTLVTQEAHQTLRKTILTMSGSPAKHKTTLAELISEVADMTQSMQKNYGVTVAVEYTEEIRHSYYGSKEIVQVTNIIRETLNNIIKHAKAVHAKIVFKEEREQLTVVVTDDGQGFKEGQGGSEGHHGLLFMQQRAAEIGGYIEIHSAVDCGTSIMLCVPRQGGGKNENIIGG